MKAWDKRENKKLLPPRDTVLQQQWHFAEFYECVVVQNQNFLTEKFLFVQNFMNLVVVVVVYTQILLFSRLKFTYFETKVK